MRPPTEQVVKLAENFNGADLRNICTEAGMFAIRWVCSGRVEGLGRGIQREKQQQ